MAAFYGVEQGDDGILQLYFRLSCAMRGKCDMATPPDVAIYE